MASDAPAPEPAPLPPLPKEDPLTSEQWRTLMSIADAVIPSVQPAKTRKDPACYSISETQYADSVAEVRGILPPGASRDVVLAYLGESASSLPGFKESLWRLFAVNLPQGDKKQLLMVLNLFSYRAGSLFLTGSTTHIADQPLHVREQIFRGWATARTPILRQLQRTFLVLFKQTWVRSSPTINNILGFPRVPVGMVVGEGHEFDFLQILPGDGPEILETDVVIVGSGCGASVCASNLAEAGHRVLVVERSYYWPPKHLPMDQNEGAGHLFLNGSLTQSDDTSVTAVSGSTWGGGGTINWSASLQTQGYVRTEWAEDRKLPFFTSAEFQQSLDYVCDRMGVSAQFLKHNKTNSMLMEGARKLGWAHKPVPQNSGYKEHSCGHCTMGCGSCEKQGPTVSFLPHAAKNGAQFIEGLDVEKILFENTTQGKTACGIKGRWRSRDSNGGVAGLPVTTRDVVIKAKRVIVSGGTFMSPLLLMRSGLKNPQIGKNLYLHPVALIGAIHDQSINPWDGPILTSVVNEFENLDGKGHGIKLEATNMMPTSWLPWPTWQDGLQYKKLAAKMKYMTGYISISRDRDAGYVYLDPYDNGRARMAYHVSNFDKKNIMTGVIANAKIQYIMGAREIFTNIPHVPHFVRDSSMPATPSTVNSTDFEHDGLDTGLNNPSFREWLQIVENTGFPEPESMFVSAHQMGTCRMSAQAKDGVVDPKGRVWGTEGLYVADASVFPSASGVNPMVTNMAISDWISRGISKGLNNGSTRESVATKL